MPRARDILFRSGTAATWTAVNPTLDLGEPGFETDTGKFKIGDGVTAWASVAYQGSGSSALLLGTAEPKAPAVAAVGTGTTASPVDHVHPRTGISASVIDGYKAWTSDYYAGVTATSAANGASGVNLGAMVVESDTTLSNLIMALTTAGTVTTAGQCFAAFFDATGNRLAVSADISGQITTTGLKTFPMGAPTPTIVAGSVVYGALLINGVGTAPIFTRYSTASNAVLNVRRLGAVAGSANSTAMPTSFSPAANVSGNGFWMAAT